MQSEEHKVKLWEEWETKRLLPIKIEDVQDDPEAIYRSELQAYEAFMEWERHQESSKDVEAKEMTEWDRMNKFGSA